MSNETLLNVVTVSTSQLKTILKISIHYRRNVLIVSPPGTGKTEIMFQACEEEHANPVYSSPGVEDPTDSKGLPFTYFDKEAGRQVAHFMPFAQLEELLTAKKRTVYIMDDLGQANDSVQKAKMALIKPGYINGNKISDEVLFFAATNRRMDMSGVSGIFEAVKNRFHTIVHVAPNIDDWVKDYALPQGLPVELIAHERFRPEFISMTKWKPSHDMVNTATPRSIAEVGRWILIDPPKELEYPIYSGAAGQAYAADLLGFLKIFRSLPSIDLILMNPEKEKVPTEPATLYAVCGALTGKASQQNIGQVIKYANRLPAEFSVMLVRDIVTKDKNLVNTKPFIEWSVKHSNVLV